MQPNRGGAGGPRAKRLVVAVLVAALLGVLAGIGAALAPGSAEASTWLTSLDLSLIHISEPTRRS